MKEKNEEKYCDMMSSLERENSTKHLFDIEWIRQNYGELCNFVKTTLLQFQKNSMPSWIYQTHNDTKHTLNN
jgi:hypothetical protein